MILTASSFLSAGLNSPADILFLLILPLEKADHLSITPL